MNKIKLTFSNDDGIVIYRPDDYAISAFFEDIVMMLAMSNYTYILKDNPFRICISEDLIDDLNKKLIPFKDLLEVTKEFKDWIAIKKNKCVILKVGPVMSRIICPTTITLPHTEIEDVCKYFFKPAVRQKSFQDKKWDGYVHLYQKKHGTFLTGLIHDVIDVLKKNGIAFKIQHTYNIAPTKQFNWEINDNIIPEPDQIEAIEACYKKRRGICKAPTGFGKTAVLAKRLTTKFGVPTLFLANKKTLLDDAADEFRDGIDGLEYDDVIQIKDGNFGKVKITKDTTIDDIPVIEAPIIVATIQSISARLKDPRTKGVLLYWLKNVCKFVMVDETQAVGTKIWDEVLKEVNAPYRIFLSATPRRTDGATLKLVAYSGPLIYTTTADEQIKKGRLCDLDIQCRIYDHKAYNEFDADLVYSEEYANRIAFNADRNLNAVIKPALELLDEDRHILVLVQSIEHGHMLKDMFVTYGIEYDDVNFVWGDTPDKVRKKVMDDFKSGKFRILIGSTIFDAGVNIPLIGGVVLAGAGKSDITLVQRIGRGARNCDFEKILGRIPEYVKENGGVKKTKIIDVLDTNVKFFASQSKNRYTNACEEFGADRVRIVGGDKSVFNRRTKKAKKIIDVDEATMAQFELMKSFENNEPKEGSLLNKLDGQFKDIIDEFGR